MSVVVACLDNWAPAVREVVRTVVRHQTEHELELCFANSYDDAEQHGLIERADIALPGWAAITGPMLDRAHRLRFIQKWGIGVDRIDVNAVRARGIPLAITAGSNAAPVAELAIALMLGVYRRIAQVDRAMREGRWLKAEMREVCFQISGKTVGLIGFGNIGRMLARRLRGFDCEVIYHDTVRAPPALEAELGVRYVDFAPLIEQSDIVSLHAPATPATEHLMNADTLAAMKRGAILINTARGELIDEAALVRALKSGHLRGAGLDTFAQEPPPADHPLLQLDQVVATPHIGGGVFDNVENVARHAIGNILRFLSGAPIAPADLIVWPAQAAAFESTRHS